MWWKKLGVLLAAIASSWIAYAVFLRRPAVAVPRLGSRLEYPMPLKVAGVVLVASSPLLGLWLTGRVVDGARGLGLLVCFLLGASGAWIVFEGFGTRFNVTTSGLEKFSLLGHRQVCWTDIRKVDLTRNRDGLRLEAPGSPVTISMRLLNLSVFARAALAGIPKDVLDASPAAVSLIGTLAGGASTSQAPGRR
jgi:hypothetical protein